MTAALSDLTAALIEAALKAGAGAADAVAVRTEGVSMEVRARKLEHADRSEGVEIGLRVLLGQRQANVSASDTRPDTLAAMAERAVAMAREAPDDPWCGLAAPDQIARDWDIAALDLVDPAPPPAASALADRALDAEDAALAVPGVSQVSSASTYFGRSEIHLAASNGFSGGLATTSHGTSVVAISGEGLSMERDYHGEGRMHLADLPAARDIGRIAGERAASRTGAGKPPTGNFPVLFDERISSGLIGHMIGAINGASIARGQSWLKDALGQQVLPRGMSLVEDPFRPRIASSHPFDGEGLPTVRRAWIEDGILTGWVLDLASARKLGMAPTGNAARGPGGPPSPSTGNLALTPGSASRDDLIAAMGTGLLVTSLIGATINPNTGDYSRGALGFWVEGGRITRPINECTIAGNLRQMLLSITAANDGRAELARVVPSLLVEGLTIAGG
jgi:PmbA protein